MRGAAVEEQVIQLLLEPAEQVVGVLAAHSTPQERQALSILVAVAGVVVAILQHLAQADRV